MCASSAGGQAERKCSRTRLKGAIPASCFRPGRPVRFFAIPAHIGRQGPLVIHAVRRALSLGRSLVAILTHKHALVALDKAIAHRGTSTPLDVQREEEGRDGRPHLEHRRRARVAKRALER